MSKKTKKKITQETASSALFKEDLPRPKRINTADVWMNKKIDPKDEKGLGLETSASEDDTLMGRLGKRMAARDFIDQFDVGTKAPKAATADMSVGQKIEMEHKDTVKKINPKYDPKKAAKMIEGDHLKEHKEYYDEKKGLPAMEKNLSKDFQDDFDKYPSKMRVGGDLPEGFGLHQHHKGTDFNSSDPISTDKVREGNNMAEQAKNAGNVFKTKYQIKPVPKR